MTAASTFIEVFDNALTAERCGAIVKRFATDTRVTRGTTGGGVDTALKDSWDLAISGLADWSAEAAALNEAAFRALMAYVRRYPFAALGPHAARMQATDGSIVLIDAARVEAMPDAELARLLSRLFRPGRVNLQKYEAGAGGYPHWHSENYPQAKGAEALHRVLAWTLYLNDDFADGETEFVHQRIRIRPKTGAILLAPTGFTHTHRGNRPTKGDKYIATSWVLFQPAERLYETADRT